MARVSSDIAKNEGAAVLEKSKPNARAVKKPVVAESPELPAYVVAVQGQPKEEKGTYSPDEVKAKALSFLQSGRASPEERAALARTLKAETKESKKK
jgi:hypothetical protein